MKIHSLHNMVQELCDKSENFELNENFFSEKLDQIRIKIRAGEGLSVIVFHNATHFGIPGPLSQW